MFFHLFTSLRQTPIHEASLLVQLRAQDASAVLIVRDGLGPWIIGKSTAWTAPQITLGQGLVDNAVAVTPQLLAQDEIDRWSISMKGFALAVIDQINVIRAALPVPQGAITTDQALAAIRAKAGTL